MYFPSDNTKLEALPRESFVSLGDDASFLLMAKKASGLPADPTWTELDDTIKMYIDAAEDFIDNLAIFPYRPRSYILYLSGSSVSTGSANNAVNMCGRSFSSIRLPKAPVTIDEITIEAFVEDEEDLTPVTGWRLVGGYSLSPEILFTRDYQFPTVAQPFPLQVSFGTIADKENVIQKMAILTLTDHFFKNPEAMASKNTTGIPGMFWDCLARLGVGGYA